MISQEMANSILIIWTPIFLILLALLMAALRLSSRWDWLVLTLAVVTIGSVPMFVTGLVYSVYYWLK